MRGTLGTIGPAAIEGQARADHRAGGNPGEGGLGSSPVGPAARLDVNTEPGRPLSGELRYRSFKQTSWTTGTQLHHRLRSSRHLQPWSSQCRQYRHCCRCHHCHRYAERNTHLVKVLV
jgi:hypothetical protein